MERVLAIRTLRHRLVWYRNVPDDGELYDLDLDPGERDSPGDHRVRRHG